MKVNTMYAYSNTAPKQVARLNHVSGRNPGDATRYQWSQERAGGINWPPVATVRLAMAQLDEYGWSVTIDPPMEGN